MMTISTIMLLIMGLLVVADAYGSNVKGKAMDWLILIGKAIGATLGSSIAVIFDTGGDPYHKLISRFIIGTIMGVIFAPVFIDWMRWERTFDYWMASAASCGMMGYLILQIIYSPEIRLLIKRKLSKTDVK